MKLGRHRSQILHFSERLQALYAEPHDLALLESLQVSLLASIKRTERRISIIRSRHAEQKRTLSTARLPKADASRVKAAIRTCESSIKNYLWLLSIWRSFGDGIAFIYLDKWAVKPLLYNVENPDAKSPPGGVLGKSGQRKELAVLRQIISSGVPALLTDITNCIRHGDVCLLHQPDPMLLEVKSSRNTNARTDRQASSIKSIHEYLATDEARNVRGAEHVRRMALPSHELHYRELFDVAIAGAQMKGSYSVTPEPAIRLLAFATSKKSAFDRAFEGFTPSEVFFLNDLKNENAWGVYYPYTLAFRTPSNLFAFLNGDVYLIVAFSHQAVAVAAKRRALAFSETNDPVWPVQLDWLRNKSKEPAYARMSSHFVTRMACELLSWNWALSVERKRFIQFEREDAGAVAQQTLRGDRREAALLGSPSPAAPGGLSS